NTAVVALIANGDLTTPLQLIYRFLRNHHRALFDASYETHFPELSGPQNISWIWKRHFVTDRASLWIETAIKCIEFSFLRVHAPVAEDQFELEGLHIFGTLSGIGVASNEIRERCFTRGDNSLDPPPPPPPPPPPAPP